MAKNLTRLLDTTLTVFPLTISNKLNISYKSLAVFILSVNIVCLNCKKICFVTIYDVICAYGLMCRPKYADAFILLIRYYAHQVYGGIVSSSSFLYSVLQTV